MDFYDALTGGGGGDMSNPVATLGAALNAPPPNVNMPQRPVADNSSVPAMVLLHLAAGLARSRQLGQSRLSQGLDSVAGAASYGMNLKHELEDRASKTYSQDLQAAQTKATLESAATQRQGQQQRNVMEATKAPYEMANLEQAIKSANDERQLKAIQVRLGKVKEKYAEDEAKASLDLTRAKTQSEKDDAQARLTTAQAAVKTADAHMKTAEAAAQKVSMEKELFDQGKKQGDFKVTQGLPGEQGDFTYKRPDGTVLIGKMPMDQAEAIKKARAEWKQVKDIEKDKDESTWVRERVMQLTSPASYQEAVGDMHARNKKLTGQSGQPQGAPAAPASAAPSAPSPEEQQVIRHSQANPGSAMQWTSKDNTGATVVKYYIGGKEVDKATVDARASGSQPKSAQTLKTPISASQDDIMQAQFDKEGNEMARGKRSEYSPEVLAWLQEAPKKYQAGADAYAERERQQTLKRAKELANQ